MTDLGPIDPAEIVVATFDFSDEIDTETLVTQVVSVTVVTGAYATPSSVLISSPVVSAGNVLHMVKGLAAGVDFKLRCEVDTDGGRHLVRTARLMVRTA